MKVDYETSDMQLQFVLRNKFLGCKKSRNEKMSDFVDRLTSISREITSSGSKVEDADFLLTLMNGIHEEFGAYVSAISGKKSVNEVTKDEIIPLLIREDELRRSMIGSSPALSDRRVLYTKGKFSKKSSSISDTKTKKKRNCYNCGKPGHYANECRKQKSEVRVVEKKSLRQTEFANSEISDLRMIRLNANGF